MHQLSRVVQPLLLSVDGAPFTSEELVLIAAVGPELQNWWLHSGYALLLADAIMVPPRGDIDPARFHAPGQAFAATMDLIAARYPRYVGEGHIPLVWLKGVSQTELGSLGWGGLGWAAVSWDVVTAALERPAMCGHWPAGIAAHELGHALGWGHVDAPAPCLMWHWWHWPGLALPDLRGRMVALSAGRAASDVCPLPPGAMEAAEMPHGGPFSGAGPH